MSMTLRPQWRRRAVVTRAPLECLDIRETPQPAVIRCRVVAFHGEIDPASSLPAASAKLVYCPPNSPYGAVMGQL